MKISKFFKLSAVALAAAGFSGAALADAAETKGGLKIKTDDGRFEASLGGRMHFDVNLFQNDDDAFGGAAGSFNMMDASRTYLRRVYLTLKGKFYGYEFVIEPDFAPNSSTAVGGTGATTIAFQDVTLATTLGPGKVIIGQFKPFRAMEDLTSSNDLTMIERPFASSSGGFFANPSREFQQGLGYIWPIMDGLLFQNSFTSLRSNSATTAPVSIGGWATSTRLNFAPVMTDSVVVHTGFSFSHEQPQNAATPGGATMGAQASQYAGRMGPALRFATAAGSDAIDTFGFELAGAFGPTFFQSEYMFQEIDPDLTAGPAPTHTIYAAYAQASWALTGEIKPYKKEKAVFGSIKPINSWGAVELTARFDLAKDASAGADNVGACNVVGSATVNFPGGTATGGGSRCEARTATLGLNYYPNPNVRFMLNFVNGHADAGDLTDNANALVLRTQFAI